MKKQLSAGILDTTAHGSRLVLEVSYVGPVVWEHDTLDVDAFKLCWDPAFPSVPASMLVHCLSMTP